MPVPTWIEDLRRQEIIERLRRDPRTRPLIDDTNCMFNDVIEGGQANFDEPWRNLLGEDRARCYAYLNQKAHIEELTAAFEMLFAEGTAIENPIVLDLGCGPCTAGIALAGILGADAAFTYIGVDRSLSMMSLGESIVCAANKAGQMTRVSRQWHNSISSIVWAARPAWRPVVVVVSYLLASPTVSAATLVAEVLALLEQLGRGSCTVLYTNSPKPGPNRSFPAFREALREAGFAIVADDQGAIRIERREGWRDRDLRYALFHRQAQRTLVLRGS